LLSKYHFPTPFDSTAQSGKNTPGDATKARDVPKGKLHTGMDEDGTGA
jgi:hypothetical protein